MATTKPLVAVAGRASTQRRVLLLALPAVGEQVLNTLVGLADVFLVGHLNSVAAARLGYNSTAALAGVGLANWVVWLMTVLLTLAAAVGELLHAERPSDATAATTRKGERRRLTVARIVVKGVAHPAIAAALRSCCGRLLRGDELGQEVREERGHVSAAWQGDHQLGDVLLVDRLGLDALQADPRAGA